MGDLLVAIHSVIPSYGLSLVVIALVVRIFIWPLSNMQFRSMAEMQKLQPLVKQLQAKFKSDPQALNTATMALYKEHKVNPPAIIAFMGFKYQWASAFYVYWFALNVFTVAQQFLMYRRHGIALLGASTAPLAVANGAAAPAPAAKAAAADAAAKAASNGKRAYRPKKRARR